MPGSGSKSGQRKVLKEKKDERSVRLKEIGSGLLELDGIRRVEAYDISNINGFEIGRLYGSL